MSNKEKAKVRMSKGAYKELLRMYGENPVLFMREVCGMEPFAWQVRFLEALQGSKFIVRPSGHGTGKTTITAVAMLWMLLVWEDCHIHATSATYDQLKGILWNQFKQIVFNSAISEWLEIDESKAVNKAFPNHWAKPQAWSKDKPQAWAGEHCKHPIGVFDECSDIDDAIYEAWSGSAYHEGSRTILLGQPRRKEGMLFKASQNDRYNVEHISTEGILGQEDFVAEAAASYGEDSDYYRIRVLGLFPRSDNSCMFPNATLKKIEDCEVKGVPVAGLDLAGSGGDNTILVIRRDNVVIGIHQFDFDEDVLLTKTREVILDTLKRYGCKALAMDTNGLGDGLGKFLREVPDFELLPVVGSKKARNESKYHNRRSEAYGRLAELWPDLQFLNGGVNYDDLRKIATQLSATRQFFDKDMRIQVLEKKDIKKELKGESPDYADALAYSAMLKITEHRAEENIEYPGTRSRYA
ncbi:MAG: hypothetical protein LBC75_02590 [Fibromonadaceae bacterium]|nr:hypothetical protein [Fibromonadaceae bacterium]